MTRPEQPLSGLLRRERVQVLRRHIGSVPKRTTLFVLVVVVGVLTVASGATLSQSGTPSTPVSEANNSTANNSTVIPGTQIASVLSAEGVSLESEVHRRTLDVKLARAASDEERATVVTTTLQRLSERLDALETRYQRPDCSTGGNDERRQVSRGEEHDHRRNHDD